MKKKSKKLSEAKNIKPQAKKLNPFEIHINRKKYDILGMKSKAERGLPGVSRSKSIKKRKGTLLQEYKFKDKKNMFLDKRIGEKNTAMTAEDKILARYTAERMRFHSKKSIYNLGDDEELTHRGQALTEIEKFDNPRSEDEDEEEEENGKLDSNFVEDAHFGGGIFRKVEGESKSRKDLIDQLIAESIKRKAEKRKIKEQTLDLTEKLDSEWKELLPLVTASKKSKEDAEMEKKIDDKFANYDILSKKLKFETRGKAGDRLKSEEEIAKEEKKQLEQLERDRLQRMLGETNTKAVKHRSADDMDDGFDLETEPETLSYTNGMLSIQGKKNGNSEEDAIEEKEEEEKEEEEEEMDMDDNDEAKTESEQDEDENSDAEDLDNLSDLKESGDEEGSQDEKEENEGAEAVICEEAKKDAEKAKATMEAARKELPYTFDIPKEYEEFEALMDKYNLDFQAVVIERMIKCHHPGLKPEFKDELDLLFTFLLQHLQDTASEPSKKLDCFKLLDWLAPSLYDLTQWNPQTCASGLMEVIKEKHQDFLKSSKSFPSLDSFVFLKLVSVLFPTSDYRHPVATPALIFLQQMLFQSRVRSSVDLSKGLLAATLVLEYCALSKRFVPEAISFIYGVLRLAHPLRSHTPVIPPFEFRNEESFNLNVADRSRECMERGKLNVDDLVRENRSEEFKVNSTALALNLLSEFCDFWTEGQSAFLLFEPFVKLLDPNQFSNCLKDKVEEVKMKIKKFEGEKLQMLVLEKKKPLPLRLYEPNIEEVYSLKKYRPMGKEKAERAKLMHKYKREMKGALREIRRDRTFLAKLKYKETVKSDMERQRKVREIFGSASEQAGELNKLQRKKKK